MCKPIGGSKTDCARCGGCGVIDYVMREALHIILTKLCPSCQ